MVKIFVDTKKTAQAMRSICLYPTYDLTGAEEVQIKMFY